MSLSNELTELLKTWGFEKYAESFLENEVDLITLPLLDNDQIKQLIPPIGPQAKFKKCLADWKSTQQQIPNSHSETDDGLQKIIQVYAEGVDGLEPSLSSPINSVVSSPSRSSVSSSQELNLIADFEEWYGNEHSFANKFPLLKNKLISIFEKVSNKSPFVRKLKELAKNPDQESSNLAALFMIPHLLGPVQIKKKKCSTAEARESFITHIEKEKLLNEQRQQRHDKNKARGITVQPYVVVAGSLENITTSSSTIASPPAQLQLLLLSGNSTRYLKRPQGSALPDESVRRLSEAKPSISTSPAIATVAEAYIMLFSNSCIAMSVILNSPALEREFAPSEWSPRFATSEQVLQNHVQLVTSASEEATNTIPHKLEIEYGSTENQKLDILGTDLPDEAPILVYIHGGYWQELNREISRYPARALHRCRVKTIVVGYDLCPAATLAEIVNQIRSAARFVFEYAEKMDSRGVYFAGHSAGAHLVAKLLSSADFLDSTPGSQRLQAAFLVSGVYDLRDLVLTSNNEAVQLPPEWAMPLSPQFDCYSHLQARRVRFYIIAAQHDSPTFKKQSREFYELLLDTCLIQNMYLEIKDDMDHFDIVECFAKDDNYLKNLLVHDIRKHL